MKPSRKTNVFDLVYIKKLKSIFSITAFIVFFSLLYCYIEYFIPWLTAEQLGFFKGLALLHPALKVLVTFISFFIILIVTICIESLPDYFLAKINADHKLKDFDLERGTLKVIAQEDIKANGYFSATGYWRLYWQEKYYDANTLYDSK